MKKILLVLFLFLFGGCSMNELMLWTELNKVNVLKRTPYTIHYRIYFQRDHLKPIRHGKKYLFFYHKKRGDLAILLHPKGHYKLYNITHPSLLPTVIQTDRKHGYYHMLRNLKKKGFRLASPSRHGFTVSVSLRRYKGVKTYRVDVKDYRPLIQRYKYAIRTYDARKVSRVKAHLPLKFIRSYFDRYSRKASTAKQKKQLHLIGVRLGIYKPTKPIKRSITDKQKGTSATLEKEPKENIAESRQKSVAKKQENDPAKNDPRALFYYYMHDASYYELKNYLSTSEAKSVLTYNQYNLLVKRYDRLNEAQLLKNGSLEELIAAYKKNKNPKYKAKILARMKELQKTER